MSRVVNRSRAMNAPWRGIVGIACTAFVVIVGATLAGQERPAKFGDPIPGLLPAEFERFRLGLNDFLEVETAEEGLGPAFNATSCAVCHNLPVIGGGSVILEVRAGYRES